MSTKPFFKIDYSLFEFDAVKNYLSSRPNLDIQGLNIISKNTIRIFFYQTNEETKNKYLSSELIEL